MRKPDGTMPLNMEIMECTELETLSDGWERLSFDCPSCGEARAHVIDVHVEDGDTTQMVAVTKQCRGCGIKLSVAEDEV